MDINFKIANENDAEDVLFFINKIAEYEKMAKDVINTPELIKENFFKRNLGKVLLIQKDNKNIGFAIFFYNYSTFTGHLGMHLEDFFILEEYRHLGIGKLTFKKLIEIAKNENLYRIEWTCLNWNKPSIRFYESLGAINLNDEWRTYRLDKNAIDKLYDSTIL